MNSTADVARKMPCKSAEIPLRIRRSFVSNAPSNPDNLFSLVFHFVLDIRRHTYDSGSVKKRTTVWLPETLVARLKKLSRKTGAPMAELFRRAVEAYVKRQK